MPIVKFVPVLPPCLLFCVRRKQNRGQGEGSSILVAPPRRQGALQIFRENDLYYFSAEATADILTKWKATDAHCQICPFHFVCDRMGGGNEIEGKEEVPPFWLRPHADKAPSK